MLSEEREGRRGVKGGGGVGGLGMGGVLYGFSERNARERAALGRGEGAGGKASLWTEGGFER